MPARGSTRSSAIDSQGTAFEKVMVKNGIDATTIEGVADTPYQTSGDAGQRPHPEVNVPCAVVRSVGHTHTRVRDETLIASSPVRAKMDPIAYRLALLRSEAHRHRTWPALVRDNPAGPRHGSEGRARGVASTRASARYAPRWWRFRSMATPSRAQGHGRVDCGIAVNPLTVEHRFNLRCFGLSAAMYGAYAENGRVEPVELHDLPRLRINEMPECSVHIVPSKEPLPALRTGNAPIAPAIANAVFAA